MTLEASCQPSLCDVTKRPDISRAASFSHWQSHRDTTHWFGSLEVGFTVSAILNLQFILTPQEFVCGFTPSKTFELVCNGINLGLFSILTVSNL